jgi:sulfur dioxygenase
MVAKSVVAFEVHPLLHPSGARSYVVIDPASRDALVIDPILEQVTDVLHVLSSRRATLKAVVDTHLHGDHLSGAALLREKTGAEVVMSAVAPCRVVTRKAVEGDLLPLGASGLRVRAAPGLSSEAIVLEAPGVLFTGDTLLVGTIGVRDGPGADGAALYETMQRLFEPLPDDTAVHPGHDDMGRSRTTIKAEKRGNRWLREKDRESFLGRWASDARAIPKTAKDVLAANAEGVTASPKDLVPEPSVPAAPAESGTVVTPPGMGAAKTSGLVPTGLAEILVAGGLASVAGCVLGFLVHPALHLVGGVVGVAAVGVGLASAARRSKKGTTGLYYLGPLRRSPLR